MLSPKGAVGSVCSPRAYTEPHHARYQRESESKVGRRGLHSPHNLTLGYPDPPGAKEEKRPEGEGQKALLLGPHIPLGYIAVLKPRSLSKRGTRLKNR